MGVAGGICAALLMSLYRAVQMPLWAAFVCGAVVITAVEFIFGAILNVRLKLNVWDYSRMKYNLMGQICPAFSLIWGVLGVGIWCVAALI